ncbi:hypothetical protein DES39_0288 [Orbus hercynius]|uniref:Uncharacterized protein n=1 Tax=Orbus hercynius TaxID=593135 RepID=A0A495RHS9_9GAMM|nr:hypothetical protein DES39_0288 [Orbus hercynius]
MAADHDYGTQVIEINHGSKLSASNTQTVIP